MYGCRYQVKQSLTRAWEQAEALPLRVVVSRWRRRRNHRTAAPPNSKPMAATKAHAQAELEDCGCM